VPVGVGPRYFCGDEERRAALQAAIAGGAAINGIDFLEVIDTELTGTPAEPSRQRILLVQCFRNGLGALGPANVRIEGGVRITPVHVRWASVLSGVSAAGPLEIPAEERDFLAAYRLGEIDRERILAVGATERGDFSTYRLSLVEPGETTPAAGFDPRLFTVDFSFKVECPSDFDCKSSAVCVPDALEGPEIDYLAKDYASFRRLMFDRLSAVIPQWRERNPADLGVAIVELLAYVGDQLSYYQDAAATEAYLGTARRRISVRRHVRLVDYSLSEGVNARVWIAFEIEPGSNADGATLPGPQNGSAGTRLMTRLPGRSPRLASSDLTPTLLSAGEFFETLAPVTLHSSLNRLEFYTWSNRSCCLPAGATQATLSGQPPDLAPGMFLLFEEVIGPKTGDPADADPRQKHVVRLTRVQVGEDPVEQVQVTDIEWGESDALPFPLCLSSEADEGHGSAYLPVVSVARGNIVAADHGRSVVEELPPVPEDAARFQPRLDLGILVHAAPLPEDEFPASALADYTAAAAEPSVRLVSISDVWEPRRDLLASGPFSQEFVAEIENDGRACLRFGDETNGKRPASGTLFTAQYRIGAPTAGNVGAEAVGHVLDAPPGITRIRNPLASFGARDSELLEEARRYAPQAFRTQERAVTAEDYARMTERHRDVRQAAARFRWTGSWYTVFVSVDRKGGRPVDPDFAVELRNHLNRYRMAGFDLEIRPPRFAPLEILLRVCVEPGYLRAHVKQAMLEAFGNRRLADGSLGFFHPDNWTFGQSVYLSRIYERAAGVDGVHAVSVEVFKRWARAARTELADGFLPIDAREIARLDNDPSLPENGLLEIELEGGL
jgi:hypothetical protein